MPDEVNFSIFLKEYLDDAREGFQKASNALLALEKDPARKEYVEEMFRVLHTLKSSSSMIRFTDIAGLAELAESLLDRLRESGNPVGQNAINVLFAISDCLEDMVRERGAGGATVDWGPRIEELKGMAAFIENNPVDALPRLHEAGRSAMTVIEKVDHVKVHVMLLDSLFNQVGELLLVKNRLAAILPGAPTKEMKTALAAIGRLITSLQENITAARLVPINEIFKKFPRLVRDLAKNERKTIELEVGGGEIELDKAIIDAMTGPLIHLVRNAVGHGIEPPEARRAAGKPERGRIRLYATRAESRILVAVEDDGAGIDIESIRTAGVEKGFVKPEEAAAWGEKEVINLLFYPGFTSIKEATGLSGRGVGLDVVKTASRELGGRVEVVSEKGKGTRITLSLPLTTAIMQTLIIEAGGLVFAMPSEVVMETLTVGQHEVKDVMDGKAVVRDGQVLPYLELGQILKLAGQRQQERTVLVIQVEDNVVALGVDGVVGQMDNIIKPFDALASQSKGFSGGAILGDGRVALLLNIAALLDPRALQKKGVTV